MTRLFLAALALLLIVAWWLRPIARPIIAEPAWLEEPDGVQPFDSRTAALAAAAARGWMTAAEEDIVYGEWYARYQAVLKASVERSAMP